MYVEKHKKILLINILIINTFAYNYKRGYYMLGVLVWIVVILLICFSVFGGSWLLPLYVLFVVVLGFYFGIKYLDI